MLSAALRLVVFSSCYLAIFSGVVPNKAPGVDLWTQPKEGERDNLECTTLGCMDCHSWCPKVKYMCSSMKTYCRKSCDFCSTESEACKAANCDQRCLQSSDGNTATCACFENFEMDPMTGKCVDIDECSRNSALCTNPLKPYCTNLPGNYICSKCDPTKKLYSYYERDDCCKLSETDTCGLASTTKGRIVGGKDSKIGAWPWQAYLHFPQALCGGTLISDRWVLTAAHCLSKGYPSSVILGADNVTDSTNSHAQTFKVAEVVIHPDYLYPNHDIALIKLDRAPVSSQVISPACLPGGEVPPEGTKCYVTGFGTLERGGSVASTLQEVDVPIASIQKCKQNYAEAEVEIDEENMLCAGYDAGEKDACQGDSGGPLVCQRCDSCNWYVAGVVSFGKGCAQAKYYGVYTHVVKYESWISATLNQNFPKHESCDTAGNLWSDWSNWAACSTTCGMGTRTRVRSCLSSGDCIGPQFETESCNDHVDCIAGHKWGEWESSGSCSELCDGGQIQYTRNCLLGECVGESERFEDCNTFPCAEWSEVIFGECSVTCGEGIQMGARQCVVVDGSSATCDGDENVVQICNTGRPCPGVTTDWSECSVSCGGGFQTRILDGVEQIRDCNDQPCPTWSEWSNWSTCSATCNGGTRTKERYCNNGRQGDDGCVGPYLITEECNEQICAVWSSWSAFGACSVTCGGGLRFATRECIEGNCKGPDEKSEPCNTQLCPLWTEWRDSGLCSVTCGSGGVVKRTRVCLNGVAGDVGCEGEDTKYVTCSADIPCPHWSNWSSYSSCSVTCGPGTQTRTRICVHETTIAGCQGDKNDARVCDDGACGTVTSLCSGFEDHKDVACHMYAFNYNFCEAYASYMLSYCKKSCCEKENPPCGDKAGTATCAKYKMFCAYPQVKEQCQLTCSNC